MGLGVAGVDAEGVTGVEALEIVVEVTVRRRVVSSEVQLRFIELTTSNYCASACR